MTDTWGETFEELYEKLNELVYGPTPAEVIRRASANVRSAVTKLERERKKLEAQEQQMMANTRRQESTAKSFADLRPGLLAISKSRRSMARIDKLSLKMRGLQQQLIETEVHSTTSDVLRAVTGALMQANAVTGGGQSIQKTVVNYERQKALLEMTQDSFAEDEEEEEEDADAMLLQIAQEAHLRLSFALPTVQQAPPAAVAAAAVEEELFARLDRLRK